MQWKKASKAFKSTRMTAEREKAQERMGSSLMVQDRIKRRETGTSEKS